MESIILELIPGDDKIYELTFKKGGVAQDITGWIVYFTLKRGTDVPIKEEVSSHIDPTNGVTQILIAAAKTESLQGIYNYSIKIKDNNGLRMTVMVGTVRIPEI